MILYLKNLNPLLVNVQKLYLDHLPFWHQISTEIHGAFAEGIVGDYRMIQRDLIVCVSRKTRKRLKDSQKLIFCGLSVVTQTQRINPCMHDVVICSLILLSLIGQKQLQIVDNG